MDEIFKDLGLRRPKNWALVELYRWLFLMVIGFSCMLMMIAIISFSVAVTQIIFNWHIYGPLLLETFAVVLIAVRLIKHKMLE